MPNYDQIATLKKTNIGHPSEAARLAEESRIEGRTHLEYAIKHIYMQTHGKFPDANVSARLLESVHILLAEAHKVYVNPSKPAEPEVIARVEHALETIAADTR